MKYTAGYDKDLAEHFFRRTFHSLAPDGRISDGKILPVEVDYMAVKLSETVLFGQHPRLGSPWYFGDVEELAKTTRATEDRSLLQTAELAATQLLIFEGFVARGGLVNLRGVPRKRIKSIDRKAFARTLYRNASNWRGHKERERFVLRRMSANIPPWVELLSLVAGNDFLEMLANRASPSIALPGE